MAARNYSNTAVNTLLGSSILDNDTILTVASAEGWPAAPFTAVLESGTPNEEVVLVGSKVGTTFGTLTRGFNGTTASAHDANTSVRHFAVADDFRNTWTHDHTGDYATVLHASLGGVTADQHHAQAHAHDGADGSGTVAHSVLTGMTADSHHPQLHNAEHGALGGDPLTVTTDMIAALAITVAELADGAVTTAKIADLAVITAKLADLAVTTAKIANDAVTSAKIATNAVTATEIASGAVGSAQLASASVTNVKIADGAVNTVKLANNAVSDDKLNSSTATVVFHTSGAGRRIHVGSSAPGSPINGDIWIET